MKKNKKEILMISIMILVLIIGITYAYFILRKNLEISNMISGYLDMTFTDNDNELILGSTTPIYEEDIDDKSSYTTFDITNTGNIDMYTEIYFKDIVMNNELKSYDFKWRIEDITENEVKIINEGTFISVKDNKRYLASNQKIEPTKTRKYRVRIWVEETEKDQSKLDSTSFKGTIAANAYSREIGGVPNEPKLDEGMIPVIYDWNKDVWLKAGSENYWYDYDNQMWANAVTVNSSASTCTNKNNCVDSAEKHDRTYYMEADAGTPISMDDINTMWVWIPRYKYRIPANIGSTVNVSNPPMIDVIFENGVANTGVSEEKYRNSLGEDNTFSKYYYTHPAFINGEEVYNNEPYDIGGWDHELTGIWVGKFNITDSASNTTILPNKGIQGNGLISSEFKLLLKFSGGVMNEKTGKVTYNGNDTYGLTSESNSHHIKGTEYAAIEYLSLSRYGKQGNPNYLVDDKKIYTNQSWNYSVSGAYQTSRYSEYYYTYNDYKCMRNPRECETERTKHTGTGASSTGSIYGVYDMDSWAKIIVMATYNYYVGDKVINADNTETKRLSGFNGKLSDDTEYNEGIPFPERKFYDLYTYELTDSNKEKAILGDAIWEVKGWFNSGMSFVGKTNALFTRVGYGVTSNNYLNDGIYNSFMKVALIVN